MRIITQVICLSISVVKAVTMTWLNKNMACVEGRTVVPFTTHRKTSEALYENTRTQGWGDNYYNEIKRV